jgi:hypothetical protein
MTKNSRAIWERPRVQTSGIPPFAKSAKDGAPEQYIFGERRNLFRVGMSAEWITEAVKCRLNFALKITR